MLKKITSFPLFLLLCIFSLNINAINVKSKNLNKFHVSAGLSESQQNDSSILFLRRFFKWYQTKYDYLDHHIFPVTTDYKNNTPYRIDLKETEKYLSVLKSSGFFSDNYINHKRQYFKEIDSMLQKTKQSDGTVDGLDYDPVVHSQEPESILEKLATIQLDVVSRSGNRIIVKMKTKFNEDTYLLYYLTKDGDKYLIDKIDFLIGGKVEN